jgi:outer membrane protein assembly factor BamB
MSAANEALHESPALGDDGTAYTGLGSRIGLDQTPKRIGAIGRDGVLVWAHETDGQLWDVVIGGDVVYAITETGRVYAIGTDGVPRWTLDVGCPGSLVVGDGVLYASTGELYAIGEAE